MHLKVKEAYGGLQVNQSYRKLGECKDAYLVSFKGGSIWAEKWIFYSSNYQQQETYEDIVGGLNELL